MSFAHSCCRIHVLAAAMLAMPSNGARGQTSLPPAVLPPTVGKPIENALQRTRNVAGDEAKTATASKVEQASATTATDASDASDAAANGANAAPLSDAERISRLERAVDEGSKRLTELRASLADPEGEFALAEAEFKKLDGALEDARQALRETTEQGIEAEADAAKTTVAEIEPIWNRAKERFEVELQEHRLTKESIAVLEQKLQSDRDAAKRLKGDVNDAPKTNTENPSRPEDAASPASKANADTSAKPQNEVDGKGPNAPNSATEPAGTASQTAPSATAIAPIPTAPTSAGTSPTPAADLGKPEKAPSKELVEAQQAAEAKAAEATAAEKQVESIGERIAILQRSIAMERELRDAVRKKVDLAEQTIDALQKDLAESMSRGEDTEQIRLKISNEEQRLRATREESRRVSTQLDKAQSELGSLQAERLTAFEEAERKRSIADEAQEKVAHLNNPFTLRNLTQWSIDHGPRILSILFAMGLLVWASKMMQSRLVRLMAGRGPRGNRVERENRAKTLVSVFHNAANLLILGGGAIMVLEEIGIPIGPLVGGAAVVGLAVAFGAQSLIKDYFTGFILLLEQQYLINDVIRIGNVSGQVERISLRMTVLRDLEGCVHFIPHGEIHNLTNMTHGWSRAVLEIGVAYKENVDRVMDILAELGAEMRRDAKFGRLILDDLTMLGVDALGDSSVVVKLFIKTEPLEQWAVKREFLRRVKNRFDELDIEIPFPHRTVYHRQESPSKLESGEADCRQSDSAREEAWRRKNVA
jgi:moderate conductance mechanosensitive channel